MDIVRAGWALAGIILVAGVAKLIQRDALSWVAGKAGTYLAGASGDSL